MSENHSSRSGSYRIELLKGDNWMPWKRRMLAILRDQGLEKYVKKTAELPQPRTLGQSTKEKAEAIEKLL